MPAGTEVLAPGIWRSTAAANADLTAVMPAFETETWSDAMVYSHQTDGELVDRDYRSAEVIGPARSADGVARLETLARKFSWPIMAEIGPAFCDMMFEGSQFVRYRQGGQFRPHRDATHQYFNRCFTVLHYFNNCEGGQTCFPEFNLCITPAAGMWLMFYSEYLHYALPVLSGEKYIFVTWIQKNS